jgi:hypothetical protein
VSSSVVHLDLLLKIPPDDVLFDFLTECGLPLHFREADDDGSINTKLRIVAAIERAPVQVRDCILASLRQIALLADEAGLEALRAASAARPGRVNPLHLADAPAHCALWMYLRHRDLFDDAVRLRGLHKQHAEPMALDTLRQPLRLPDDLVVDRVRLCEATLLDETTGGEFAIRAPAGDSGVGVLDLLESWMPHDNPIRQERFRVVAAMVDVEYFPEAGQATGRSAMLALKRRGGSNLCDFDLKTQGQLAAWLSHWRLTPANDPLVAPVPSLTL